MGAFDHLEWTYNGAFEQLFVLGRGEFEQKFSKNSNARGLPGGMFKLRFDWYKSELFSSFLQAVAKRKRSNNRMQITEFPARLGQHKLVQREIQEK